MSLPNAEEADRLLKEALRAERRLCREEASRVDRMIDAQLGEAVDSPRHAESVLLNYHYTQDPRHQNQQADDMWFVHEDGHQVFVAPDPSRGLIWHHYEVDPQKALTNEEPHNFRKGDGVVSLDGLLGTLHTVGSV